MFPRLEKPNDSELFGQIINVDAIFLCHSLKNGNGKIAMTMPTSMDEMNEAMQVVVLQVNTEKQFVNQHSSLKDMKNNDSCLQPLLLLTDRYVSTY